MHPTAADIVAAARDLFLEAGPSGMTMRAVAKRVGISATAIYRHFDDKEMLLAAVVAEGRELLGAYLFQALRGSTPAERLTLTGAKYLDFAFDHPGYYQVFFLSWDRLQRETHIVGEADVARPPPTLQFLFDRVREAAADGAIAVDPADDQAVLATVVHLWAHVHGLAALWVSGGAPAIMPLEGWRAMCAHSVATLVRGLEPR